MKNGVATGLIKTALGNEWNNFESQKFLRVLQPNFYTDGGEFDLLLIWEQIGQNSKDLKGQLDKLRDQFNNKMHMKCKEVFVLLHDNIYAKPMHQEQMKFVESLFEGKIAKEHIYPVKYVHEKHNSRYRAVSAILGSVRDLNAYKKSWEHMCILVLRPRRFDAINRIFLPFLWKTIYVDKRGSGVTTELDLPNQETVMEEYKLITGCEIEGDIKKCMDTIRTSDSMNISFVKSAITELAKHFNNLASK